MRPSLTTLIDAALGEVPDLSISGRIPMVSGSLIAAMLGHSLQSMVVFGQVLIFGRGDTDVHPLLWILVFGCPIWVYLGSQLVRVMLPPR